MAVELLWLDGLGKEDSIELDDDQLGILKPCFEILRKKSGLVIDPYSRSRLSPEHSKIIREQAIKLPQKDQRKLKRFIQMLEKAVMSSKWILVLGD